MTWVRTGLELHARLRLQSPLVPFIALYAVLYGAFGAASPFLPAFMEERGIAPELIGVLFGAGTAIRLLSAPIAGRVADQTHALRLTLAICALATALAALGYLARGGFWLLLVVSLVHALALAPTTGLADGLALVASRRGPPRGFEYGWVRGAGSAAFIVASIAAGAAVASYGLSIVVWLQALLMALVPFAVWRVPPVQTAATFKPTADPREGIKTLLRLPTFRRVVLVAALILASHALHDTFSVIRWKAAGISPQAIGVLWSLSVAAEVAVFFVIGPWLLRNLAPSTAVGLAAVAGAIRWLIAAFTTDLVALSLIQPLHGVTFALLHLACMRLLARSVPESLAATAQAVYGTVGVGAATALATVISGWLYARLGSAAFCVMSVQCLAALPVVRSLRAVTQDNHAAMRPEG
jgi:MFS transporter, PPP family, 3-phenylpropionic acid transporter